MLSRTFPCTRAISCSLQVLGYSKTLVHTSNLYPHVALPHASPLYPRPGRKPHQNPARCIPVSHHNVLQKSAQYSHVNVFEVCDQCPRFLVWQTFRCAKLARRLLRIWHGRIQLWRMLSNGSCLSSYAAWGEFQHIWSSHTGLNCVHFVFIMIIIMVISVIMIIIIMLMHILL
jgi:hypothetical protein